MATSAESLQLNVVTSPAFTVVMKHHLDGIHPFGCAHATGSDYAHILYRRVCILSDLLLTCPDTVKRSGYLFLDKHLHAALDIVGSGSASNTSDSIPSAAHFIQLLSPTWWNQKISSDNWSGVPCQEGLDPYPLFHHVHNRSKIIRAYDIPVNPKEMHDILTTVLRTVWPKNIHLKFQNKIQRCLDTKEKRRLFQSKDKDEIKSRIHGFDFARKGEGKIEIKTGKQLTRYMIQWWCLFHLGGYQFCLSYLKDPIRRLRFVKLWNRINHMSDEELHEFVRVELMIQPYVLLLCLQTHLVYAIRQDKPLYHRMSKTCPEWVSWELKTIELGDRWRNGEVVNLEKHAELSVEFGVRTRTVCNALSYFYETMPGDDEVDGNEEKVDKGNESGTPVKDNDDDTKHDVKGIVSSDAAASRSGKKKEQESDTIIFSPTHISLAHHPRIPKDDIARLTTLVLDHQSLLVNQSEEVGKPSAEHAYDNAIWQHKTSHKKMEWILCERLVESIMDYFHCDPLATNTLLSLMDVYFGQCAKMSPSDVTRLFSALKELFVYEYQVWKCILEAYHQWTQIYSVPLPIEQYESQLARYQQLHGEDEEYSPPRSDLLMWCPNCETVCSLVDQSRAPGSTFPKHYVANEVAGFANVHVDVKHTPVDEKDRILYCGRRTGNLAVKCMKTQLKTCSLTGHMVYCHEKSILICSQKGCGGKMQLNVHENTFNSHGWQCSTCAIKKHNEAHGLSGAKIKQKSKRGVRVSRKPGKILASPKKNKRKVIDVENEPMEQPIIKKQKKGTAVDDIQTILRSLNCDTGVEISKK